MATGRAKLTELLKVKDVAQITGWKESTVRQKIWLREIEFVKLGRSIRFRPETIEALLEEGTIPARRWSK
jgi:excisionase family DNA binding protein